MRTPGPWAVCDNPINDHWYKGRTIYQVWESDWCGGARIADITPLMSDEEAFATAAFIVLACNSHDALTAENSRLRKLLEEAAVELEGVAANDHPARDVYPSEQRRYDRDMALVREIREIRAALTPGD